MDREVIARQIRVLASDLNTVASAMERELEAEKEAIEENERIHEDSKRAEAGTPVSLPRGTIQSPVNHFRSRLEYISTRLSGTTEYMRQKQVW